MAKVKKKRPKFRVGQKVSCGGVERTIKSVDTIGAIIPIYDFTDRTWSLENEVHLLRRQS